MKAPRCRPSGTDLGSVKTLEGSVTLENGRLLVSHRPAGAVFIIPWMVRILLKLPPLDYTDREQIAPWAHDAVAARTAPGLVNGTDGAF